MNFMDASVLQVGEDFLGNAPVRKRFRQFLLRQFGFEGVFGHRANSDARFELFEHVFRLPELRFRIWLLTGHREQRFAVSARFFGLWDGRPVCTDVEILDSDFLVTQTLQNFRQLVVRYFYRQFEGHFGPPWDLRLEILWRQRS